MARWIQDPQYREEIDEVTQELKLPVYKASAKGKFRQWLKECWNKIEDYLVNLKQSLQEQINGKEPSIYKKSGFNLEKTNLTENDSNKLFTAKGALDLFNRLTSLISEKEPKISKLSGFNLSKSDADDLDSSSTLATSRAVKKVRDALNKLNLTWGSITNKPVFGLKVGDFMEGHRLAESLGVKEYGGLISSYGQKIAGNAYYDSNTKKMFYCKETNSYTSANSTYFEPFDNKELLNRLNNLQRNWVLLYDKIVRCTGQKIRLNSSIKKFNMLYLIFSVEPQIYPFTEADAMNTAIIPVIEEKYNLCRFGSDLKGDDYAYAGIASDTEIYVQGWSGTYLVAVYGIE